MLMGIVNEYGQDESREHVKDHFGQWICKGMYVNKVDNANNICCQGWITEAIDENDGVGKIKVRIVSESGKSLDKDAIYVTDFEQSINWCKALTDG